MNMPILVYATGGAGASLMIWTIKKMLWPNLHTNNPLCPLNSAHNQILCDHWFGDKPLEQVYTWASKHQQVLHVEPSVSTMPASCSHRSIFIKALDKKSVLETAILIRHKMPQFCGDQTIHELASYIAQSNKNFLQPNYQSVPEILDLDFWQLAHGDLDFVLDSIYRWLDCRPGSQHCTIERIHHLWRSGNQLIWQDQRPLINIDQN